jgi:hypothetical protein
MYFIHVLNNTSILGGEVATTWSYDLDQLYAGAQRADPTPLIAPFSEQEALRAVHAMSMDSTPGLDGIGLGLYSAA